MPLPPKNDPRRPLHLAVRSARILGILFILFGMCTSFALFGLVGGTGGGMTPILLGAVLAGFYLGPGICYLIFSFSLSNYRPWAVTATLVLASLHTLLVLIGIGGLMLRPPSASSASVVMMGVIALVGLAMAQMIYHLIRSYESVRHPPFGREAAQGFAPIFPTAPVPSLDAPTAAAPPPPPPPPPWKEPNAPPPQG